MIRTLTYASTDGADLEATLYSPATDVPAPVIVCVHGGAWKLGDRHFYRHLGPYLAGLGYAVFAIDYRLISPKGNRHPAALEDVRVALGYLRANGPTFGVDASRIVVMGDSAGGHLASLVALTDSVGVSAVVGIYGVYDLASQWRYDVAARPSDNITEALLGVSLLDDPRSYFESSPLSHVTRRPNAPAAFLAWGSLDDVVDPRQSERFRDALKAASFRVRTMTVPAGHYWVTEPLDEPTSNAHAFATRLRWFLEEFVPVNRA